MFRSSATRLSAKTNDILGVAANGFGVAYDSFMSSSLFGLVGRENWILKGQKSSEEIFFDVNPMKSMDDFCFGSTRLGGGTTGLISRRKWRAVTVFQDLVCLT